MMLRVRPAQLTTTKVDGSGTAAGKRLDEFGPPAGRSPPGDAEIAKFGLRAAIENDEVLACVQACLQIAH